MFLCTRDNIDNTMTMNLHKYNLSDKYLAICQCFQVIRRLRERNEPILLFAETEVGAFKRLRQLEILQPDVNKVCTNPLNYLQIQWGTTTDHVIGLTSH